MSCGVDRRHGLDPTWLWWRLATTALIRPLAWEPPCTASMALKKKKKKKKCAQQPKRNVILKNLTIFFSNPVATKIHTVVPACMYCELTCEMGFKACDVNPRAGEGGACDWMLWP